jgi:fructose-bisphosphate aldolase class I
MNEMNLVSVAEAMVAEGKGILAIDESTGTCKKRFDSVGVECTEESRRAYREMLLTTPGLSEHISGVILFDETIRQATADGTAFVKYLENAGILPGIKVDAGAHTLAGFPSEKITAACLNANAHALARYAALCQEANLVPIVEPEVLIDGDHSLDDCFDITEATLHAVFNQLYEQNIMLEGAILKASMVISGSEAEHRADIEQVATATVQCLLNTVPAALGGIVFLSGGQSDLEATAHLDAMNRMGSLPWPLSFSYGRALQAPALKTWGENPAGNTAAAQRKLAHRAKMNGLAVMGRYEEALESS